MNNRKVLWIIIAILVFILGSGVSFFVGMKVEENNSSCTCEEKKSSSESKEKKDDSTKEDDLKITKSDAEKYFGYYLNGIEKNDYDLYRKAFHNVAKSGYMTKSEFQSEIKNTKEAYGDDFKLTSSISNITKIDEEETKEAKDYVEEEYEITAKTFECYQLAGTFKVNGSLDNDTYTLNSIYLCNINGELGIVIS